MASLTAGLAEPDHPGQHNTREKPQPPSFKQPLRSRGQPDVMIGIKSSPARLQPRSRAIERHASLTRTVDTNTHGAVPSQGVCEPFSDSGAARMTSNRSVERQRRHRPLSSPPFKQHKSKENKIVKEQESRLKQARDMQYIEDFLEYSLGWQAPTKQTSGNVKKSGMVGDKQQTMKAFCIFADVLHRHAISPLEPRPGETCIQAVVRETMHQIKSHICGKSSIVLSTYSLMAEAESLDGPHCTITSDHEQCLLDNTSSCIRCRKQRRREAYEDNLRRLLARRGRASSAASIPNTR